MEFVRSNSKFPFSAGVITAGKLFETVLCPIDPGRTEAIAGSAGEHMAHIFKQLDEILAEVGLDKSHVCSARLYLQEVNRDIAEVNKVWADYFAGLSPNRRAYGVQLQAKMLVEAAFVAEFQPK